MNKMKQTHAFFLAVLMLCFVALFSACEATGEANYKVSVVDQQGNPYAEGIVVQFLHNGAQVGMQTVDSNGIAEKTLATGDYKVELQFTSSDVNYVYNQTDLALSANKTELQIVVNRQPGEKNQALYVGDSEFTAYFVEAGCTEITLDAQKMSYFLFAPQESGQYQFSLVGSETPIGYYGTPHFVQESSAAEVVDNKFTLSLNQNEAGEGGPTVVIGVGAGEGKVVLAINRKGDAEKSEMDVPWSVDWQAGHQKADSCQVAVTGKVKYFDIQAKSGTYNLVYDEAEGYYRLGENGPVVLVALGRNENPRGQYVGIYERVNGNGMYGGSNVVRYFFDEAGKFQKKEQYTDCLIETFKHAGITAYDQEVYHPLTKDLVYVLQNGFAEWWDKDSPNFLETFEGANAEYAWLFACCYFR